MRKRSRPGEVRVVIGSGHLAGALDARDAGPIPESAGVKVVPQKEVRVSDRRQGSGEASAGKDGE